MASTDKAAEYDLPFINLVYKYLPENLRGSGKKMIIEWAKAGLIQRDRLVEFAMASASDGLYGVVSENGRDHCDGSDTKTTTINSRFNKAYWKENVIVTNISNKVGPLRVVAYDPERKDFRFYFIFDYDSVRNYNRIEFDIYSNSKYNNGECGVELSSFEELAKRKL